MVFALLLFLAQDPLDDPELGLKKLQPAPGLKVQLFAAEPQVANPVGIDVDEKGRVWVAETRRYNTSALYILRRGHWYFDDLACRTVQDRIAVSKKYLGAEAGKLAVDSEVVRLLEDRDGDGRADRDAIFADDFRTMLDGVASGILARGDSVWLTNVPNLWRLRDPKGEGRAQERTILHQGFGVRFGNSGHDLHGLCFGPDGKIYFSMGDRGFSVGPHAYPDEGGVLRCNPDGSNLEVYARGLRNPQGLAFDAQGNLWTCDNNADMGDRARWLWIVEGGDYGWRVGYQYATDPWGTETLPVNHRLRISRENPWMTEGLWEGRAPYVLPPAGYVTAGPCGMSFYPGVGLPSRYDGRFLVCDFVFGITSVGVKPRGAGFEVADTDRFLWGFWTTDCKFGPDGALYAADWLPNYAMKGKGRIYKVTDPERSRGPAAVESRALLAAGMKERKGPELATLLGHPSLPVRQAAQFELAERQDAVTFAKVEGVPARLHAIWGLGQIGASEHLLGFLKDRDAEVRAQAARVLGERPLASAFDPLLPHLDDPSPRVRFFAAPACAKAGRKAALAPLLEFVRRNSGDPWLRHAGVRGLVETQDLDKLLKAAEDPSREVRLAVLLALRKLERPEIEKFLQDPDPELVLEAARAISDVPIPGAMPALAKGLGGPAGLRAVNAAFRTGADEALARFAVRVDAAPELRAEAVRALIAWGNPSVRDRVVGLWRPLPARPATKVLEPILEKLLGGPDDVKIAALPAAGDRAESLFRNPAESSRVRLEALAGLLRGPRASEMVAIAAADPDPPVRREGVREASRLGSERAAAILRSAAAEGPIEVRQVAIAGLGALTGGDADTALGALLDALIEGTLPPALHLELREATARKTSAEIRGRLSKIDAAEKKDEVLAGFRMALEGGDAAEGKKIFNERATVACLRCHAGRTTDVGPPLTKLGAERTREQILESILYPNRVIAQGYGQEVVRTTAGEIEAGRIQSETADELVLLRADGTQKRIAKKDIDARKAGLSAMPDDVSKALTRRELRDLVAYLATLR